MVMRLSGDGTITGLQAGGLPDASITQNDLAPNVAGTGPAFSAYATASTAIANGTAAKVSLQAKEFDTANSFDATTNSRFQPNVAGYYQVTGEVLFSYGSQTTGTVVAGIAKNGSVTKWGNNAPYPSNRVGATALIYLNGTTDYVELFVYQSSGVSNNVLASTPGDTFLQGYLARAA